EAEKPAEGPSHTGGKANNKKEPKKDKAAKRPKKEQANRKPPVKTEKATESKPAPKSKEVDEIAKAKSETERLSILNAYAEAKSKHDTIELRAEIARLKLEKELLSEKIAHATATQSSNKIEQIAKFMAEKEDLTRDSTLAKLEAEKLAAELKVLQADSSMKTSGLMAEISEIETQKKRDNYANAEPLYLDNPLKKNGTLVISDRRIPFNGAVTGALADRVTTRINYFNNKDPKKPIFIVIDDSPGGSVMAGYRILKAMEGSEAPIYVVVKSFAASMAATITTLAEKSFVYPNAIILHHQISQSFMFSSMNLTEQKENVEDLKKWWARLADPIAEKMGITSDEFIEMMYKKTVSGDWTEFGDDAVKLKWADHVVNRIHETALLKNPDAKSAAPTPTRSAAIENGLTPAIDDNGNHYMILPRRNPKDLYLMHNPDGFYRFK
ncbi:ATP-dependent Clp protease proteolytic subunit, partial [Akkermansiaceae bacterium]|nr:ATP-dependent Clp protease proteolytic subunit [Akkermansiaceae bacterium]